MSPKRVPAPGRPLAPLCLALCLSGCAGDNDVSIGSIAYVVLAQSGPEVDPAFATASADFRRADDDSGTCTLLYYFGYCRLWECLTGTSFGMDGGPVQVTAEEEVLLTDADHYTNAEITHPFWLPEQTIDVEFEGVDDDPPPLTLSLDAPELVTIVDPDPFPDPVDREEDITVDWSGGRGVGVVLSIDAPEDDDLKKSLVCYWPIEPSEGVIPSALMTELATGPAELRLNTQSYNEAYSGTWAYGVSAIEYAATREITLE